MSAGSTLKRQWKLIINIVTVVALLVLIYAIRNDLLATVRNLVHVNAWALLLLIPVELLDYHAQTRLYQRLFGLVGNNLSYKFLFKTSVELNFVNHVFPSGGVTGISYFGVRMSKGGDDISGGKATLIQVMKLGLTFLSFEVLIVFGLICLAVMGRVNSLTILVAGSLSTLLLVGTVLFVYVVGSKKRINDFFTAITEWLNRIIHVFLRSSPESINIDKAKKLFTDFHDNYEQLKSSRKQLRAPFWYALLANLAEVLAIYVVYIAFGKYINFGAIILAYAIANFAGLVSVLPGGVGVYEGLMTAVLAATGVPARLSLPVTIMYRVLNTLIQIPPGYVLYQRALNRGETVPRMNDVT
jgi:uncharacterized protein (TIRG00374 family)